MADTAGPSRYSAGAIAFHWAIALLILAATGLALFRETFGPYAVAMISLHKILGLLILILSLGRLAWRLSHPPPPFPPVVAPFEQLVANTVHRLLYVLMIAVPLAGWLFVSLAPDSRPLDYRGRESIPELPITADDQSSYFWHEVHELLGFAMIGLLLLHVAGVAQHQFLRRTNLFYRMAMLPERRILPLLIALAAGLWAAGLGLGFAGVRFWR